MRKNFPLLSVFVFIQSFVFVQNLSAQGLLRMRDVLAQMPDSVVPLMTRVNRLDCIDFIENDMPARVRNVVDEYVELEALTPDYMRLRTSEATLLEARLLTLTDSTQQLCVISTVEVRADSLLFQDSQLHVCDTTWHPLAIVSPYALPTVEQWLTQPIPDEDILARLALQSLRTFHPLAMHFTAGVDTLSVTLQLSQLTASERNALQPYLPANLTRSVELSLRK